MSTNEKAEKQVDDRTLFAAESANSLVSHMQAFNAVEYLAYMACGAASKLKMMKDVMALCLTTILLKGSILDLGSSSVSGALQTCTVKTAVLPYVMVSVYPNIRMPSNSEEFDDFASAATIAEKSAQKNFTFDSAKVTCGFDLTDQNKKPDMKLLEAHAFPGLFNHALFRQNQIAEKTELTLRSEKDKFPFIDSAVYQWDGPIPLSVSRKKIAAGDAGVSGDEVITTIHDTVTSLAGLFDLLIPVRFECSISELHSTAWGQRIIFLSIGQVMSVEGTTILAFSTIKLRSMSAQYLLSTATQQHPVSLDES